MTSPDGDVQVTFPGGAVDTETTVTYTHRTEPSESMGSFRFAGTAFTLEATDAGGNPVTTFNEPFTISIHYDDADWQGKIWSEAGLNLAYWNGTDWVNLLPCEGCSLDTENNVLAVLLNHLTDFGMWGSPLIGDVNGDCSVDVADLALLAARWKITPGDPGWQDAYDFDNDDVLTVIDLMSLQAHWNQVCP